MTVLCGGATSSPRPFTPAAVFLGGIALSDLLEHIFPRSAWAEVAAFIAGEEINVQTLCATDPPAVPTFDALDITSILTGTPAAFPGSFGKMADLAKIAAWYTFCQCNAISTPNPPPAPAYPPDAPTIGSNFFPPTTGATCSDLAASFGVPPRPAGVSYTDVGFLLPGTPTETITPPTGAIFPVGTLGTVLPGVVPQVRGIFEATWDGTRSIGCFVSLICFDSTGTFISSGDLVWQTNSNSGHATIDQTLPVPANTHSWVLMSGSNSTVVGATISFELIVTCGNPNLPVVPCCPPDVNLQGQLQLILNTLNQLTSAVPAPPRYRITTVHVGLSGTGTLPITNLFGVLVDITTGVPTTPQLPGQPPYEWSVGWMSIQTADGMIQEVRITRQHQIWAPELMPLATILGFFLYPGFVVNFSELSPA